MVESALSQSPHMEKKMDLEKLEQQERELEEQIRTAVTPETEESSEEEESEPEVEDSVEEVEEDDLDDRLSEALKRAEEAESKLATQEKRVKDNQRAFQEKAQEAADLRRQVESLESRMAQLEESRPDEPTLSEDLSAEYPEFEPEFQKRDQEISRLKNESTDLKKDVEALRLERREAAILAAHPDINDIWTSDDFLEWERNHVYQKYITGTLENWKTVDPKDIIHIISEYKESRQSASDPVEKAKTVATPKVRSTHTTESKKEKPTFTKAQIAKMTDDEYFKYEDAITQAYAEGRVR
jgi:DNA repair exonuclease SbcCD ATPase subunit